MRFNPAPGWPRPPEGFTPGPSWRPDPSWPPAPPGWQLWVPDDPVQDDQQYYARSGPLTTSTQYQQTQVHAPPRHSSQQPTTSRDPQIAPPPPRTSGMAIASFVLGLLGIVGISAILGIVFGFVALRRVRHTLQRGKGLAIAGILLGCLWLAVGGWLYATGAIFKHGAPAPSGSSAIGQHVDPFSLTTGDCFDNPAVQPGHVTDVGSVLRTACNKPHNAQIFATFRASGSASSYPGSAKLTSIASSGCDARAKASLNSSAITSSMAIRLLFPLQSSWAAGHRSISCIIYSPTTTMKASVLNG